MLCKSKKRCKSNVSNFYAMHQFCRKVHACFVIYIYHLVRLSLVSKEEWA